MNRINRLAVWVVGFLTILAPINAVEPVYVPYADSVDRFSSYYTATMSGTALKSTIQNPAGSSKRIFMEAVTIYSSVAGTFNIELSGTAATATAGTMVPLNNAKTSAANSYTASNVGSGTLMTQITFAAAGAQSVSLSGVVLASGVGTTHNITVVPQFTTGIISYTWKLAQLK